MKYFFALSSFLLLTGCASSYIATRPSEYAYKASSTVDSIEYALCFNVLQKTSNTRYANIEQKVNLRLVAVKLFNHTNSPIILTEENLKFMSGGFEVLYVTPDYYYQKVQRHPGYYFFWLFANPSFVKTTISSGGYGPPQISQKLIVIPIGIPIAILNFAIASNANKQFKQHLLDNALLNRTLQPNEYTYGYIFIRKPVNNDFLLQKK
jgi:hypothetical protein